MSIEVLSPGGYFSAKKNSNSPNEYIVTNAHEDIVCRYRYFSQEISFYQYKMPRRLLRDLDYLLTKLNEIHS